jgi:hypothetical protein
LGIVFYAPKRSISTRKRHDNGIMPLMYMRSNEKYKPL